MRWPRPAAALLSLALLGAACGADDDSGNAEDASPSTAPDRPGRRPPAAPGFDGSTIRVGVITDAGDGASLIADALTAGSRAYFDALNATGGVDGRYPVEVVAEPDPAATPEAAYLAVRDDVVLLAQVLGTEVVTALLPRLAADGVVAAPSSLDARWVHDQQLLPIGSPYQVQSANALTWYVEGGSGGSPDDVICALIRDDDAGDAGLAGFEAAADAAAVELAEVVRFPAGEADFAEEVDTLDAAGCEMVLFAGLPAETSAALGRAYRSNPPFSPQWIGQSSAWEGQLGASHIGAYLQEHLLVAGEGTEWGDTSVPGMAQLLEDAPATQPPDLHFAFGYAQARAVHQVLEAAVAAGDLSRDGIRAAMIAVEVLTFDGLIGNYRYGEPEDRDPPRASTIFAVDPATPGGLRNLEADVISDAAEELEFD